MEYYYLDKNNKQAGTLSIDQLKSVGLTSNTLVWKEGFAGWKQAKDVEELKRILGKTSQVPNTHQSKTAPSAHTVSY